MVLEHLGQRPRIHADAVVAPTATICGDVRIGAGSRILHGACMIAEGGRIELGENVIVLQNAVIRSTAKWSTTIGSSTLIGPNAHVVGSSVAECVFIATGASVFHGSRLKARSEVRINGVVHVRSVLPADATVPIGWVAVGDPASILPPNEHDAIWAVQQPLNFPETVYGVERPSAGESKMPEVARRLSEIYAAHADDSITER